MWSKVIKVNSNFTSMRQINQLERSEDLNKYLLEFAKSFKHAAIFDSNNYADKYGKYELLAAFGAHQFIDDSLGLNGLESKLNTKGIWWFGHFQYDFKNHLEKLKSKHPQKMNFGDFGFYEPKILFVQKKTSSTIEIYAQENSEDLLEKFKDLIPIAPKKQLPKLTAVMNKSEYINKVYELKEQIQYGNVYEANFCQEYYAKEAMINPYENFAELNDSSPVPFSAFYKQKNKYALCLSPERYICKRNQTIISQPIKGTAKRGQNEIEDSEIKVNLKNSLKEQTENVMIVDLVRNDLSRIAQKASVKVEELFGVYSFPTVHQLISTISCQLKSGIKNTDIIRASFPMGSMTGAPKIKAMEIIEELEESRRELYSGTIGYFDPEGDFDFNVVIRTLFYDEEKQYLSLQVGGAITKMSIPEEEYQECLLKAKAIFDLEDDQ